VGGLVVVGSLGEFAVYLTVKDSACPFFPDAAPLFEEKSDILFLALA